MGKIKKIDGQSRNIFELHVSGEYAAGEARFGKNYGDLPQEKVPEFLYELAGLIEASDETFCQWLHTCEEKFNELVEGYRL